jgi:dTDP-4-amino-4,6-dideoxygalactose transaminase
LKHLRFQQTHGGESNCSYFPVIFDREERLLQAVGVLNANQIYPRRYFYPSVNQFDKIVSYAPCPVAEDITRRILCLPLYRKLGFVCLRSVIEVLQSSMDKEYVCI